MKLITRLFLFALLLIPGAAFASGSAFITTWQTTMPNESITIPTVAGGFNYAVDWGDTITSTSQTGNATHSYVNPGIYTVTITGTFPNIRFNNNSDKSKLLTIEQWGTQQWNSMNSAFYGCNNLVINATDVPDLSNVLDTNSMFYEASSMNANIGNWDVSHVTDMGNMFRDAVLFNQNINTWDVSHVVTMDSMFRGATAFNQPLNNWNTSSVTHMSDMFRDAATFNQPIGSWDMSHVVSINSLFKGAALFNQNVNTWNISSLTALGGVFSRTTAFNQPLNNWNVSNITDMQGIFYQASAFNQPLNNWDTSHVTQMLGVFANASSFNQPLNNWNTSSATDMRAMFAGATSFDQDISNWDVSHVNDFYYVPLQKGFISGGGLSKLNYDALLQAWSQLPLQPNLVVDMGTSKYCAGSVARLAIVSNYHWTISDGGEDCPAIITSSGYSPAISHSPFYPVVSPVVPVAVTSPVFILKPGATGNGVKALQKFLISKGYAVIADGSFGNKTKKALQKFQKAHGLKADGVLGKKTLAIMK